MALPSLLDGKLRLPLIGAPMFIVSGPELVAAQCKAGIVGSFPGSVDASGGGGQRILSKRDQPMPRRK